MDRDIENFWKIFENINNWLRFADAKASILLTVLGLILTLVYTNANAVFKSLHDDTVILTLAILSSALFLISATFCFLTLLPTLKKKIESSDSIIYFGDIANKQYDEYRRSIKNRINSNISEELILQIYENSKIARIKHSNFSYSIKAFLCLTTILIMILIRYLFILN